MPTPTAAKKAIVAIALAAFAARSGATELSCTATTTPPPDDFGGAVAVFTPLARDLVMALLVMMALILTCVVYCFSLKLDRIAMNMPVILPSYPVAPVMPEAAGAPPSSSASNFRPSPVPRRTRRTVKTQSQTTYQDRFNPVLNYQGSFEAVHLEDY